MDLWASFLHRTLLSVTLAALPAAGRPDAAALRDGSTTLAECVNATSPAVRPRDETASEPPPRRAERRSMS